MANGDDRTQNIPVKLEDGTIIRVEVKNVNHYHN